MDQVRLKIHVSSYYKDTLYAYICHMDFFYMYLDIILTIGVLLCSFYNITAKNCVCKNVLLDVLYTTSNTTLVIVIDLVFFKLKNNTIIKVL